MMFCLASRDFDLSVGSTIAFAGVLCAMVLNATGNTFIAIVAAVAAGAVIGFVNGAVIAYLRINALITTLATMEIVRGLGFIVSHGQAVGVSSDTFIALGGLTFFGISLPIWVTLACFIVFGVLLNQDRVWSQHARDRRQSGSVAARRVSMSSARASRSS